MKTFLIFFFVSCCANTSAASLKNSLLDNASPYLAMHGKDPVAWQIWNRETINRAKKENKLIYVSSGYFSCHWCHVMQKESYQNKEIANLLNKYFIPVKIDRELASALDTHLIDFVEKTQGRAGWPLNVFITPDGYPLVGMTYVPAENFLSILKNIKRKWTEEKNKLEALAIQNVKDITSNKYSDEQAVKSSLIEKYFSGFMNHVARMSDDFSGGFGQQNKFPSVPQLNVLLKSYEKNKDESTKQFLLLTLDKMASQGLYDHLQGGFFRYTVDPTWHIPHFEKMLYDNALLASLYIDAGRIFNKKEFRKVAISTLDYLLNIFRTNEGAYISSLSALDNNGIEGGYYLWEKEALESMLTYSEMTIVKSLWSIQGNSELEAGFHLRQVSSVEEISTELKVSQTRVRKLIISARIKLLKARNKRIIPKDDKILASWNGLALSAFSKAAKEYKIKKYAIAAAELKNYLFKKLWKDGSLSRSVKNNKVLANAELEDYAYVSQGLYDWLDYSETEEDFKWLDQLLNQAWSRFYGPGGWILAENMLLKYGQGQKLVADGVLPSASAVLIRTTLKYTDKSDNLKFKDLAIKALSRGHTELSQQPFWYATQIQTLLENKQLKK